jgi:sec-independent protein translocase protein TatC
MERRSEENAAPNQKSELTFWEHLEALRWVILQVFIVVLACMLLVFANKDLLTRIIFAPQSSDFVIYRALCRLAEAANFPTLCPESFSVELLNTRLAAPFFTHMTASLYVGLMLSAPVALTLLWRFIAPALYPHERKRGVPLLFVCIALFATGVAIGYYLVFPLAFRFLGTYQFGSEVVNRIDLSSYMSIFYSTLLSMGLVFEMPILSYSLSRIGLVSKELLKKYRKYAVVIILVLGAIITPTSDPFTLMLVSVPMFLLYLLSIRVAKSSISEER